MYLEQINSPSDLRKLSLPELKKLAGEIRDEIVYRVSKNGGHLASNLGVVELTIALHYVFNSPADKLIWDVGHQSYPHKLVTGRYKKFSSLRKYKGISGFPRRDESEHDAFGTGHSSTSISAAVGILEGRDRSKEDFFFFPEVRTGFDYNGSCRGSCASRRTMENKRTYIYKEFISNRDRYTLCRLICFAELFVEERRAIVYSKND